MDVRVRLVNSGRQQRGQSLLMMLIFSAVLMMTMAFVYNSAQLLSERQDAKMMADHAAFTTATRQARLLNLNAYINRSQVANELAIAQAVSIASWSKFASVASGNIEKAATFIPPAWPAVPALQQVKTAMSGFADGIGPYIDIYAGVVKATQVAQDAVNAVSSAAIIRTPGDYVRATGKQGDYSASLLFSASTLPYNPITGSQGFMDRYTKQNRTSMDEVIKRSMTGFLLSRRDYDLKSPALSSLTGTTYTLTKKGGAELINMNEWKSVDTLSLHVHTRYLSKCGHKHFKYPCLKNSYNEIPVGYGSAAKSSAGTSGGGSSFGGSVSANPRATGKAQNKRPNWDVRDRRNKEAGIGVPDYYDLSRRFLAQAEPRMDLTVSVKKDKQKLKVSTRGTGPQLSGYVELSDTLSSMTAISQSEVYFQRPWGQEIQQGGRAFFEKASLFSPYWQVRLSDIDGTTARAKAVAESAFYR